MRGKPDEVINRIIEALRAYEADHPNARIDLYRQNSVSVRVRIIDSDLAGLNKVECRRLGRDLIFYHKFSGQIGGKLGRSV